MEHTLLKELEKIARDAGAAIMAIYQSDDFDVQLKGDDSPLTKADLAAITSQLPRIGSVFPGVRRRYSSYRSFIHGPRLATFLPGPGFAMTRQYYFATGRKASVHMPKDNMSGVSSQASSNMSQAGFSTFKFCKSLVT